MTYSVQINGSHSLAKPSELLYLTLSPLYFVDAVAYPSAQGARGQIEKLAEQEVAS